MSSRRRTRNSNPAASDQPPLPSISASTRVYQILELRTRIVRLLGIKDQAIFMSVEKQGLRAISGVLYHTMCYNDLRLPICTSMERQQIYDNAVKIVDARGMILSPAMIRQLGLNGDCTGAAESEEERKSRISQWLGNYQPKLLDVVIPLLRQRYANLRTVLFGSNPHSLGSTICMVELDAGSARSASTSESVQAGSQDGFDIGRGRIHHIRSLVECVEEPLVPSCLGFDPREPGPPSDDFTLCSRFTLDLRCDPPMNRALRKEWAVALRDSPLLADLYEEIDTGNVTITLDVLSSLYQRQIDAGHTTRLAWIQAPRTSSFSTSSFRTFASIASVSLTFLTLADSEPSASGGVRAEDLPDVISIIERDLRLYTFHFALRGDVRTIESACGGMLTRDSLRSGGCIDNLCVYVKGSPIFPFNLLRCLSPLVIANAFVQINGCQQDGLERFLPYLRCQEEGLKYHLSTIDFPTLGAQNLEDIFCLEFDETGKPLHLVESLTSDSQSLVTNLIKATDTLMSAAPPSSTSVINIPEDAFEESRQQQLLAIARVEREEERMEAILTASRQSTKRQKELMDEAKSAREGASLGSVIP